MCATLLLKGFFQADARDQPGQGEDHGRAHHLLVTLSLHRVEVGVAGIELGLRGQGRDAVQLAKGAEDLVIGKPVLVAVVVQLFAQGHQQLRVLILVTTNHAEAVDQL